VEGSWYRRSKSTVVHWEDEVRPMRTGQWWPFTVMSWDGGNEAAYTFSTHGCSLASSKRSDLNGSGLN